MRTIVKLLFVFTVSCFWLTPIFAQTPPPSSPASEAPLDILAGILVMAGAIYGGYKFQNNESK